MGLSGLITLDVNSDVKKCLNLQVSSTLILVTSTVMPNMHNSGLKGNFQIAISTPLVYLDKCAKKVKPVSLLGQGVRQENLLTFFFFYEKVKKFEQQLEQIFHLLLALLIFLWVLPFFWPLSFISFGSYVLFSPSVSFFLLSFSCLLSFQSKFPDM